MLTDYLHITDRDRKISKAVASISFFLLFPGFLFYHQFVAMGLIPRFAAGFFGYVSVGALLALLVILPLNTDWLKKTAGNRYVQWVLVFLIFTSLWTLAHYLILNDDYITKASVQSLETLLFWSCLFLVGLLLPLDSKFLRWSFLTSFLVIMLFLLYFSVSTDSISYYTRRIYGQTTDISSYQGFARSVLFTLLLLLALFNSFRARACFIIGGVFVLFMLISRSDFYAFLAVSTVLCVIYGIKQPKYLLLLLLVSVEVVLLAVPDIAPRITAITETRAPEKIVPEPDAGTLPADGDTTRTPAPAAPEDTATPATGQTDTRPAPDKTAAPLRLSRQFEVLDISSSKSWKGRFALQKKALGQIAENPLLGKFGGHVLTEDTGKFTKGHTGRYAHNALSAWVSYGLAGFLLYVSLTLFGCLVTARHVILKRVDEPLWTFAFTLNLVCLLLIIVSKPVFWPLPALGWGVLAQALISQKTRVEFTSAQVSIPCPPVNGLNRNTSETY